MSLLLYSDASASMYSEYTATMGKAIRMNGVLKVPVVMAAEMIQDYHRTEIPWLNDVLPKDVTYVKVFKPYEELKAAILDLQTRKIDKLPFVMPHSSGTFLSDQAPSDIKAHLKSFIQDTEIKGWVKEFAFDDTKRHIKGWLYLKIADHDPEFIMDCENGKITNVSIGFVCSFDEGGSFNGQDYLIKQTQIQLGHLAGLVHDMGKCPAGVCGINMDHHHFIELMADQWLHHLVTFQGTCERSHTPSSQDSSDPCLCTLENTSSITPPKAADGFGNIKESSRQLDKGTSMPPSTEELEKIIADLRIQLKTANDTMVSSKTSEQADKIKKLEFDIAARDQRIADIEKENSECKEGKKKMEDVMKADLIPKLTAKYPSGKINGQDIKVMCLHDLSLAWHSVTEYADSLLKKDGIGANIPMPSDEQRDAQLNNGNPNTPTPSIKELGTYDAKAA